MRTQRRRLLEGLHPRYMFCRSCQWRYTRDERNNFGDRAAVQANLQYKLLITPLQKCTYKSAHTKHRLNIESPNVENKTSIYKTSTCQNVDYTKTSTATKRRKAYFGE
jgi:hypothetical protein